MDKKQSIFKKVFQKKTSTGELSKQIVIDLSPWHFDADESKGTKEMNGYTCQIRVSKYLGKTPRTSFINFDPFDKDVREALKQMYAEADKLGR